MPTPLGDSLRTLRARYRRTQAELALAASIVPQYVSQIERGMNPKTGRPPRVDPDTITRLGNALGETEQQRAISVATLLRAAGYAVPLAQEGKTGGGVSPAPPDEFARAVAAEVTQSLRDLIDADPRLRRVVPVRHDQQRIPADGTAPMDDVYTDLPGNTDRLVALTVRGHCMEPDIRDGETVVIDTERPAELKDVVAVYLEGDWTLKRLRKRNGVWLLVPDNTNYEPIEIDPTKVRVLGVVVQVSRGKP